VNTTVSYAGKVLVTGANGYIGSEVIRTLNMLGIAVAGTVRLKSPNAALIPIGNIDRHTNWAIALKDIDCVIHTAGKAHESTDGQDEYVYDEVNVAGTLRLLQESEKFGVKRFIFISTIKVHGEFSVKGCAFSEVAPCNPVPVYARSKLRAEQAIASFCEGKTIEYVIIRPPLVYAASAPANFRRLMKIANSCFPLPFGRIDNRRSMIALPHLVDIIRLCISHPRAANEVFDVSDDEALSLPQIIKALCTRAILKPWILPVPLKCLAVLNDRLYSQLVRSLEVDNSYVKKCIGWQPEQSALVALKNSAEQYKCSKMK